LQEPIDGRHFRSSTQTLRPRYPTSKLQGHFLEQLRGCAGTILAGLIISSGAVNAIASLFRSNELPENAIIFVTSPDCVGVGQDWVPLDPKIAAGRFIIGAGAKEFAAGGKDFVAGQVQPGVSEINIIPENLPRLTTHLPFKLGGSNLPGSGATNFVAGIGEGTAGQGVPQPPFPITFEAGGDKPRSILVAPPALSLLACQKK
jgi:hypothetical protein